MSQAGNVTEAIQAVLGHPNVSALMMDGAASEPKVEVGVSPGCCGDREDLGGRCWYVKDIPQQGGCCDCVQESICGPGVAWLLRRWALGPGTRRSGLHEVCEV